MPDAVVADFAGVQVREVPGRPMSLERRGSQFWATLDDPDWNGSSDTPKRIERQVVMTTGSHHQQVYWYATGVGRLLGQLPAEYLIAERRWIPRSAALMRPPSRPFSETGSWNSTCVACHATDGKPRFESQPSGTQIADTKAAEFGIACEACHGPAEEHVRLNRNPWRRYALHLTGAPDVSVTHPERLTPRRSSQVCGQCHSVWEFSDRGGEQQANMGGLPYRPGADLATTRLVVQPTQSAASSTLSDLLAAAPQFIKDSFWSDGMIRVSGREYNGLIESPCFKNAADDSHTLSCFSCHDMHQSANDRRATRDWTNNQLAPRMDGNAACLQCHASFAADLPAHTRHAASSAGSSCYNCHMPYTTYGLLKTLRSHQISTPSVQASLTTGRPNACNLCHLDKTLKWTADRLQRWYGTPVPALDEDEQGIAAALLWLFRGDAGQRAIVADSMGRLAAQQASGATWMAPYLAQLLDDPYEALRFIVARSLRTAPGFQGFEYEFTATRASRLAAASRAMNIWKALRRESGARTDRELLFDADGNVRLDTVNRLVRGRDTRRVFLRE
jgi:nitrate/TMAO reductase-like tetraheme cytochrome c subunit